jgi:fatty acid desaturase
MYTDLRSRALVSPAFGARAPGKTHVKASVVDIAVRDPVYKPTPTSDAWGRIAEHFICDRRDLPFLKLMAIQSATVIPTGVVLFLPHGFSWWLAGLHVALVVYFLGPFVLMLHNTSHRRLFRQPWGWMNRYIPWVLGPFFGESPEAYFAHHVGMHHPENNLDDDLSTTLPYRRDSIVDFSRYFFHFLFFALFELAEYFGARKRRALFWRTVVGELSFYSLAIALLFVSWRADLVVFIVPLVVTRFAMMAGNWAQHAFVDEASPENNYRNSITCINCVYNRRCFNDGYHIGHHLKATRHWTELPEEFARNVATYAKEGAIVFAGIDFFGVWCCLMLQRYEWLAARLVELGETQKSPEEVMSLLRNRTAWTRPRSSAMAA